MSHHHHDFATTGKVDHEDDNINNTSKITLKAAVQACWPNETPLDIVRLIKQGYIEVSSSSSSSLIEIEIVGTHQESENHNISWKIVRQHGKRIIRPNQYIRRRQQRRLMNGLEDDLVNNIHYDYEIRMVPSYPIVIAMYKPCGYIVTTATTTESQTNISNLHPNITKDQVRQQGTTDMCSIDVEEDSNIDENTTLESSSTSVYNLLTMSSRVPNDCDIVSSTTDTIIISPYLSQLRAVGRLDKNTEGLLLFSNHGRWNIALTNPITKSSSSSAAAAASVVTTTTTITQEEGRYTIWKRYRCVLQNPASAQDLQYWINGGIPFRHYKSPDGIAYSLPARSAQFVSPNNHISILQHIPTSNSSDDYNGRIVDVTIGEGKYRQVRRCWESLSNNKVIHLQRLSFGPIELMSSHSGNVDFPLESPQLQRGQWRLLSTTELHLLEKYVHLWYRNNPNYYQH